MAWIQAQPYTLATLAGGIAGIRDRRRPSIDFSLFKTFPVSEKMNLQFRAEAYNLFNSPWFGNPSNNLSSTTPGRVTPSQSNDPRNVQLALRLSF